MLKTTDYKIIVPTKEISLNCAYVLYQFYSESDMGTILKFDRQKTQDFVEQTIDNPAGCVFIAVADDTIVGIIIGFVTEPAFSHGLAAVELGWWVNPAYRGTKIGVDLMDHYENWCREVGANVCVMSTYPRVSHPKLGKLYERRGYEDAEVSYRKVLT